MFVCVCVCVCVCLHTCVLSLYFLHMFYFIFQAVEFFAEWALCPRNVVFLRVQTGVFDPLLIGDKPKWYSQSLQKIDFHVYDENSSTLGAALATCLENQPSDDNPTGTSRYGTSSSSYIIISTVQPPYGMVLGNHSIRPYHKWSTNRCRHSMYSYD